MVMACIFLLYVLLRDGDLFCRFARVQFDGLLNA